ncbi:MAG TPA: GTPase HflX [archaeon]|nr:GTPase HflX [archaeon]
MGTRTVVVQRQSIRENYSLSELKSLGEAAGYSIIGSIEQIREADPSYQIGEGKAEELAKLVKNLNADKVIFENDLKPIQEYNLAKLTGVEVIDRFRLILEIFTQRAATQESKLQIQLAKLKYELPRAREKVRLAKKGEQPGFHGLGMYDVDVYYDMIRHQMATIRNSLKKTAKKRGKHRERRLEYGFSLISLAGYTNAGKSTLFNMLAKEKVPVGVGLFTTLSTLTRAVNFSGKKALLTDTVGFIDKLPLILIEAFHSTLEETIFSDVILLVIDVSEPLPEINRKIKCCLDTIREIGASGITVVTVLNKIDLITSSELNEKINQIDLLTPHPVAISALHEINLDRLKNEVANNLENYINATFVIPMNKQAMSLLSWIHSRANVIEAQYENNQIKIKIETLAWFMNKINAQIEKLGGKLLD